MIKKAILTVSDKTGLERLVQELDKRDVKLISSGGTGERIRKMGYKVTDVSDYTGVPEMPGGLVKTLHPKVHGGILGSMKSDDQRSYMSKFGIEEIDLVVVNFYPFDKEVRSRKLGLMEAAEYIDIGGPALTRAAAKATLLHGRVTVLTSPAQYNPFIDELNRNDGDTSLKFRLKAAVYAFAYTSSYDDGIRIHFEKVI